MPIIKLLDKETINKIAAGEVVDRPSSIVKELLENSIDAGATAISVEIKGGGIDMIRISDNGKGIDKDDIPTAFKRHATSKISDASDLAKISSLGFRGEALSSISAVSQVELITKTQDSPMGCRFLINGGEEEEIEEIGVPDGTTFIVRNVFYNTPARKKFLKSQSTEAGYIAEIVEKLSLSHPEISFKFINNGQTKIYTSGSDKLKDVIYAIYGKETSSNLLDVSEYNEDIKVSGYVAKPVVSRGNRSFENYFINGRYIKNNIVSKAIEDAYKPYIMQHKYPFCVLHIAVSNEFVDVNVHPSKMEIRFENSDEVYELIFEAVSNALKGKVFIVDAASEDSSKEEIKKILKEKSIPEPFESKRLYESGKIYDFDKDTENESVSFVYNDDENQYQKTEEKNYSETENKISFESKEPLIEEKSEVKEYKQENLFNDEFLSEKARDRHKLIGQVFDTYWIVEYKDKMYIMDQHAAHEKVLYERLLKKLEESQVYSQQISPSLIVSLTAAEEDSVNKYIEDFKKLGFEIDSFGGNDYAISAIPAGMDSLESKDLFLEIIDEIVNEVKLSKTDSILHKLASAACKAAVKGNTRLSNAEVNALIDDLLSLENPYHCPHGRPTLISFSKYELEKKFKRIV
ncbi:MAG: DNA mismatch repair endonuclease MutL [Lachnospiraceae bacterium]|nr:DNA mismatch repair endonuclease MutL [Lachnospiraceae bacterium]